jgi:serine/threonine-protein kinase
VGDGGQISFSCIGRYEIAELIGRGGMGEVFRCRDPLLGRTVAVKVMRLATERPDRTAELLARFQREAAAAGALQHPGIVAVHDLGRDNQLGLWYIVLELVEGRSLDRLLEERRRLSSEEAVALAFQVADALAFAHARGIVHRDVKPANVLVRKDGTTKLLDFGIAAVSGSDLTLRDQLLGSPAYMAPERIRGRPAGAAADQFSLGVVLYEMLAGVNPFDDETHEGRMVKVLECRPAPLSAAAPQVPRPLLDLVARMLARRPEDRLPSSEEVVDQLGRVGLGLGLRLERYVGPDPG